MSFPDLWGEHEILLGHTVSVVSNCVNHLPGVFSTLQVTAVDFLKLRLLETETNTSCLLVTIDSKFSLDLALASLRNIVDSNTVSDEPDVNLLTSITWLLCDNFLRHF